MTLPAIESGPLRWGFAGAGLMEVIAGALTQGQLPQGIGQLNGMALQPLRTGPVAS